MRKLDNWLDSYLTYVNNTEPPTLFKTWSGLSAIAAVLQRKCSLQIGMNETFPNMFVVLVGPSGAGKSRAINPAKKFLVKSGIKLAAQKLTNEALIRDLQQSFSDNMDDGVMKIHSSLTIFSSELAVLIRHQNQTLVDDLCDLYDCEDKWDYKTKGEGGSDEIIKPYLNILGGITPTTFRSRLPSEAIGGGLTSRMVCVYEEKPSRLIPIHFLTKEEIKLFDDLLHDLEEIKAMKGEFKLTDGFIQLWTSWYMKARTKPPFSQQFLDGYNSRRPLHVLKMSMNISACRTSDMIISMEDLSKSIHLLEQTEINMPKTFEGMGENKNATVVVEVMKFVAAHQRTDLAAINKKFIHNADEFTLRNIIKQLEVMKYIKFDSMAGTIEYLPEGK